MHESEVAARVFGQKIQVESLFSVTGQLLIVLFCVGNSAYIYHIQSRSIPSPYRQAQVENEVDMLYPFQKGPNIKAVKKHIRPAI